MGWVDTNTPVHHTTTTTTSSSSSSSAPAVDPRIAQNESLFRSAYIALWGEAPTEDYIKHAAMSGMNTTEFVERERHKEAFKGSQTYENEFKGLLTAMRQMGAA